jgi:chorismate mutase
VKPFIVAGPCSAESENQVIATAKLLCALKIDVFRAGIWKPRTKPSSFEGVGETGLKWLNRVQTDFGLKVAVEVANSSHVESALKANIDVLWIGARTITSPFAVQEVCNALKGVDLPVMVKNPIIPDIELWVGAIERLQKVGIKQIIAIHRGFGGGSDTVYRNNPQWHIPIELHRRFPNLKMLCDSSHIAGDSNLVGKVSFQAMQLGFNGLMIEVHCNPQQALSDANQQITPNEFKNILDKITVSTMDSKTEILSMYRNRIDDLDDALIEILAQRMQLSKDIGVYKRENNISVLQKKRYEEILQRSIDKAKAKCLNTKFIKKIIETIHEESIENQF